MKRAMMIMIVIMLNTLSLTGAEMTTFYGSVTDDENNPVGLATVHLTGDKSRIVTTDSSGYFMFDNVDEGEYVLEIKSNGFKEHSEELNIDSKSRTVNITLKEEESFIEDLTLKVFDLIIAVLK